MKKESIEIEVFHGTAHKHFPLIKQDNFNISVGIEHEEWLGTGAYFFAKGVPPEPDMSAENWAIAEAWDNNNWDFYYRKYCVIKAFVKVEKSKFLDLTDWDGLETFNYLRDNYVQSLRKAKKKLNHGEFKDGHIINKALENIGLDIDVVKGNFYFKFTQERICNSQFRTPNCTVVAVRNVSCIDKNSIKLHKSNIIR